MKSFWNALPRPIMALAPMADVTDAAFRRIISRYSKNQTVQHPGVAQFVMWTEFVSADGLARAPEEGRRKLLADLMYTEEERPIVAQFFTSRPENMEKAALIAAELGFDGVDINMGCPDRSIEKQGAGAAHMKDPERAKEVIAAAKQGARHRSGDGKLIELPVSVKTRLGYNKDELDTWLPHLLEAQPAAITIHARTRKEMSKVPARWERIARAVEIRNEFSKGEAFGKFELRTLIIGNGDVENVEDARKKVVETGADGAMLGRAIFGTPWLFSNSQEFENRKNQEVLRRILSIMVEHTKLFEELFVHPAKSGAHKNFAIMKKHYKAYVADFDGAADLRAALMAAPDASAVEKIAVDFLAKNG